MDQLAARHNPQTSNSLDAVIDATPEEQGIVITEKALSEISRLLLTKMAQEFGGDCTLNELRVMNAVSVGTFRQGDCSPTLIARQTGIPKSTVSRSLASLTAKGWLVDEKDPNDRRRRIISLSDDALNRRRRDLADVLNWLQAGDSPRSSAVT